MAELRSVCVYCGSNTGASPEFSETAAALGGALAGAGIRLVYGGGSIGLMGILARAVLRHGGAVTGIIPQFLKNREVMLQEVSELIVTADMHERKRAMFERSDAFVALPGGIGTLEEVVEMMTWAQLGQHKKPILIADINGFWGPLREQFARMAGDGFLHKDFLEDGFDLPVRFCNRCSDIVPTLRQMVAALPEPTTEAARHTEMM